MSYTATVGYNREVSGWRVETDLNASFRDEYKPVLLGPTYNIDSYWLVGANIALSPVGGRWQVALYGRNLFNEEYDLTRNFFLPPVEHRGARPAAQLRPARLLRVLMRWPLSSGRASSARSGR